MTKLDNFNNQIIYNNDHIYKTVIDNITIKGIVSKLEDKNGAMFNIRKICNINNITLRSENVYTDTKGLTSSHRLVYNGKDHNGNVVYCRLGKVLVGSSYTTNNKKELVQYYINIIMTGIMDYDYDLILVRAEFIAGIRSALLSSGADIRVSAIDVCIDTNNKYENMLAYCGIERPNVDYIPLDKKQKYETTTYVEDLNRKQVSTASSRSYWYDKTKKDNLNFTLTRFEVKMQPRFFYKVEMLDTSSKVLDNLERYRLLHFNSTRNLRRVRKLLQNKINAGVNLKELDKISSAYRLYFDRGFVEEVVSNILSPHSSEDRLRDLLSFGSTENVF